VERKRERERKRGRKRSLDENLGPSDLAGPSKPPTGLAGAPAGETRTGVFQSRRLRGKIDSRRLPAAATAVVAAASPPSSPPPPPPP